MKQLDTALYHLLGRIKRDGRDFGACELALHILAHCRASCDRTSYQYFLRPFISYEQSFLCDDAISGYEFDVISSLQTLIEELGALAPGGSTPEREAALSAVRRRLAWFHEILGESDEAMHQLKLAGAMDPPGEAATMRDDLAIGQKQSCADRMNLLFVMNPSVSTGALGLGKMAWASAKLRITGEWSAFRKHEPLLSIDGSILERNDPFADQLRKAVRFAEHHFIDVLGKKELQRLPRHYSFALGDRRSDIQTSLAMTGGSAGLGFTLLALANLDGLKMRSPAIRIRSMAACTGTIDDSGNILPVDDAGVELKVRAAFFSPCRSLAVPAGNRQRAEDALRILATEYPSRGLELVTVSNVTDVLRDARIVEWEPVSAAKSIGGLLFRKRKHLITATSCAGALLALALFLPPRYTQEAASCAFRDNRIDFINRFGFLFRSYEIPYAVNIRAARTDSPADPSDVDGAKSQPEPYRLYHEDIAPGGGREILFIGVASNPAKKAPAGTIHVHLFSTSGNSLLQVALWDTLSMMDDGQRADHVLFELNENCLHDFDQDGFKELFLLTRNHLNSPTAAVVLSLQNGTYRTFKHYGHLYAYSILDMNGDGTEEIILAGVHGHPLNAAVVAVLDPDHMEGATPVGFDPYFIPPCEDVATAYIKLPRSVICGLLPPGECQRPHAVSANPVRANEIWFGSKEGEHGRSLLFYFDSTWTCTRVGCTGTYETTYEIFRADHALKPLAEYLDDLRAEVEYWDGKGWTRQPIVRNFTQDQRISITGGE